MASYEKKIRRKLKKIVCEMNTSKFVLNPDKDFTRNRKLGFLEMIFFMLNSKNESLKREICDFFDYSTNMPSDTAFRKQLDKIKIDAFEHIFYEFGKVIKGKDKFKGYRLLACDGSDLRLPRNPDDKRTFMKNSKEEKGFNQIHINAMYDLLNHTYVDMLVQYGTEKNEHSAFKAMVKRLDLPKKTIFIGDRGYEGYNSFAHVIEKGHLFLVRVKDVKSTGILSGFSLPNTDEFDETFDIALTYKHSNQVRDDRKTYKYLSKQANFGFLEDKDFYKMRLRVVRFQIPNPSGNQPKFEAVVTNLPKKSFSPSDLSELYHMRWGIETSFRKLKHTIGLSFFHAKKTDSIIKEFWTSVILYNFCESIVSHVNISQKDRKFTYSINFSYAVKICRRFLKALFDRARIEVTVLISKELVPVKPDRHFNRSLKTLECKSFFYRAA